jgi:FlaA1/EpsC-like NDP-sugar epimerase
MKQIVSDLAKNRLVVLMAFVYAGILAASLFLSYELRFDFIVPQAYQQERLLLFGPVIAIQLLALVAFRQLGSMMRYFSIPDLLRVVAAIGISCLLIYVVWWLTRGVYAPPRGIVLSDLILSLAGICGVRLALRIYWERVSSTRKHPGVRAERIAIMGAGDVGASLGREFLNMPSRGIRPVAFFDDDESKHGMLVHGLPVVGGPEKIATAREEFQYDKVVIAMPSATDRRIQEVIRLITSFGLKVETVPSMEDLSTGRVKVTRLRPVEVEDLLGRAPVDLDSAAIRELLEDKVVLVTGAGGSIGSELCRQVAQHNPQRLLMVDRSEINLFEIERDLGERGLGARALPLIADILDEPRMEAILRHYRPQVIFHAAAHKHVFMMERQPGEAVKNNAIGTRLLGQMASAHGVETFVLISTDKAINPTSVMGATKRLAEIHLQSLQRRTGNRTKFVAVRFGNVLGSSGSVIPIFRRQIANGGPVTVTHPDVVRYFMTIPEAVGLVLQSTVLGMEGEILVLDMGRPVKILDLAKQMIELSGLKPGDDIEIKFTGLKPGEKLFEELRYSSEDHSVSAHPWVNRLASQNGVGGVSEQSVRELESRLAEMDASEIKTVLQKLVPEYTPYRE